jgi:starch synthase
MSRILMVASEALPFIKTGGLADVMGALPVALAAQGHEVAVLLPRYARLQLAHSERIWYDMPLRLGPHTLNVAIDQAIYKGVRFLFVDCPPLYGRGGIYDEWGNAYSDNHLRFAVLCRAAVEVMRYIFRPQIVHCHDWQAAVVAPYLRHTFASDPTFQGIRTILTIHNLGYQGRWWWRGALHDMGLDDSLFRSDLLEFHGDVNTLKGGIVFSDVITTVSPRYAREIQTPEFGFGLDGLLRARAANLVGILNGADYHEWNPATDPLIPARYSAESIAPKQICKEALCEEFGLPQLPHRPLAGITSRFVEQKGFDIFAQAVSALVEMDIAFVVLGSGERQYEEMFSYFARVRPDKFALRLGYDNALAHRIQAGCDLFVVPSRYEPCGLTQMYALRYGTVPVVRATGGLDDTISEGTGFKFWGLTGDHLIGAFQAALDAWQDRWIWEEIMRRGMRQDYSWNHAASEYAALYRAMAD